MVVMRCDAMLMSCHAMPCHVMRERERGRPPPPVPRGSVVRSNLFSQGGAVRPGGDALALFSCLSCHVMSFGESRERARETESSRVKEIYV